MTFIHSLEVKKQSRGHRQTVISLPARIFLTQIIISLLVSVFGLISSVSAFTNIQLSPAPTPKAQIVAETSSPSNMVAATGSLPVSVNIAINEAASESANNNKLRIISLSPHLTEIVFALGLGEHLIAVSDYSDYPPQAASLPSVSSYQGTNNADVLRLAPTHVLAWQGGNKQQDIDKLKALGLNLHASSPNNINDLADNIYQIATFLGVTHLGKKIALSIENELASLRKVSKGANVINAAYLMNITPLSGAGRDDWINSILDVCAINNIYRDGVSSYLQISMANLIRQQPPLIVLASHSAPSALHTILSPHSSVYQPLLLQVNPDTFHRFTPRVISDVKKLCQKTHLSM